MGRVMFALKWRGPDLKIGSVPGLFSNAQEVTTDPHGTQHFALERQWEVDAMSKFDILIRMNSKSQWPKVLTEVPIDEFVNNVRDGLVFEAKFNPHLMYTQNLKVTHYAEPVRAIFDEDLSTNYVGEWVTHLQSVVNPFPGEPPEISLYSR